MFPFSKDTYPYIYLYTDVSKARAVLRKEQYAHILKYSR